MNWLAAASQLCPGWTLFALDSFVFIGHGCLLGDSRGYDEKTDGLVLVPPADDDDDDDNIPYSRLRPAKKTDT